jgi:hypothetical protein
MRSRLQNKLDCHLVGLHGQKRLARAASARVCQLIYGRFIGRSYVRHLDESLRHWTEIEERYLHFPCRLIQKIIANYGADGARLLLW